MIVAWLIINGVIVKEFFVDFTFTRGSGSLVKLSSNCVLAAMLKIGFVILSKISIS